jgi:aminopeptidase N
MMEWEYLNDFYGRPEALYEMFSSGEWYRHECESYQRPIAERKFETSWQMFDAHLYPGGGWRLANLKSRLPKFWDAVRAYIERFGGKCADTRDFFSVLEECNNVDLSQFADEFIHSPGYPKLNATFAYEHSNSAATVTLKQSGRFTHDVTVTVITEGGARSLKLSLVPQQRNPTDNSNGNYYAVAAGTLQLDSRPIAVRIDPDSTVFMELDFNPGEDMLCSLLQLNSGDVINEIRAVRQIVKAASVAGLERMVKLLPQLHWGVRLEAVREMVTSGVGLKHVEELFAQETHAVGKMEMSRIISQNEMRSDVLHAHLRKIVDDALHGKGGYLLAFYSTTALGSYRRKEDLPLLFQLADDHSHYGHVRSGAYSGLAKFRGDSSVDQFFNARLQGSEWDHSREDLVLHYGEHAYWLDERQRKIALETISAKLHDEYWAVRNAAAKALVALGEPEGSAQIRSAIHRWAPVYRPQTLALADKIDKKNGDGPSKEIEELRKRVAALEQKK